MDTPFKSPVILSLCPGILGLERGIIRALGEIKVAAYVEIEAFIVANLVASMEAGILGAAPIWTDAKTFDARPFRGRIHGIIGGYPCQPFSVAGKRGGKDDPRHLWPHIAGIIDAVRPVWCFFENVPGHLTLGFPEVYSSLSAMGYNVEAGIYSAVEVGAPHERERFFILAVANSYRTSSAKQFRSIQGKAKKTEGKKQQWQWLWNEFVDSRSSRKTTKMEHTCSGNEWDVSGNSAAQHKQPGNAGPLFYSGCSNTQLPATGQFEEQQVITQLSGTKQVDRWPAPKGHQQYEWEAPRSIESGMGYTVNGYNFTEDIIRAIGNSVVEQTAEKAMIDLLKKQFSSL